MVDFLSPLARSTARAARLLCNAARIGVSGVWEIEMPRTNPIIDRPRASEEVGLLSALLSAEHEGARQRTWQEFVRRYERTIVLCVVHVLRRYGATFSRDDLNDLVADVWLMLLRNNMKKLRQYDAGRGLNVASFIRLVATNTTIDYLRARRAHANAIDGATEREALNAEAGESPVDCYDFSQRAELAREALCRLSSDERSFVVEVFQQERSPEDMARTLGVSTNTIYSRKFKIRAKLARIVANLENDLAA
jgi:RNA polymerase sigma-70 factor (ECF subfamily)